MTASLVEIFILGYVFGMLMTVMLFVVPRMLPRPRPPQPFPYCPHGLEWDDCPVCRH